MNIEIALFDAFLAGTYSINMALHKSQRTKTLNSGLIEVYNIVFFFHLSTILVKIGARQKGKQLKSGAQEQLENYSIDEKFKKTIEKTHLIKIRLIFSGHELIDMAEMI